jgi:chaperonin cofactor prefoldin
LVFRQFSFEQKMPPQDSAAIRLKDLEKKNMEIQTKLDQVQESLNQVQSKTTQGGPTKPGSKKHH